MAAAFRKLRLQLNIAEVRDEKTSVDEALQRLLRRIDEMERTLIRWMFISALALVISCMAIFYFCMQLLMDSMREKQASQLKNSSPMQIIK